MTVAGLTIKATFSTRKFGRRLKERGHKAQHPELWLAGQPQTQITADPQ
jgi:hypothetical protein